MTSLDASRVFDFEWQVAEDYRVVRRPEDVDAWPADWPEQARDEWRASVGRWDELGVDVPVDAWRLVPTGPATSYRPLAESSDLIDVLLGVRKLTADAADITTQAREFAIKYGLLWPDRPMAVGDFLAFRDYLSDTLRRIRSVQHVLRRPKPDDRTSRALSYLRRTVKELNESEQSAAYMKLALRDNGTAVLSFEPQSLASALWIAVALEACGETTTDHCRWCDKSFRIGAGRGARRWGSLFCSDECAHADNDARRVDRRRRSAEPAKLIKKDCPYCGTEYVAKGKRKDHCGANTCAKRHSRKNLKESAR